MKVHWELRSLYWHVLVSLMKLACIRIACAVTGKKIVVVSLYEHIGDIIACEPVIRHLKQSKKIHLTWAINTSYAELVEKHPAVDTVLRLQSYSEWVFLQNILKSTMKLVDQLVDLHIDSRRCKKYGFKLKHKNTSRHHEYFTSNSLLQAFTRSAGLPELNEAPVLYLDEDQMPPFPTKPYIVVHTQSNNPHKDWQPAKWTQLCLELSALGFYVVEVGLNRQIETRSPGFIDFTGKRSLAQIGQLIKTSAFFIGVDSGFAHMANALGVEGRVLMGHYVTGKFHFNYYNPFAGKYADPSYIIYTKHGSLQELEVNEVIDNLLPVLQPQLVTSSPAIKQQTVVD